MVSPNSRFWALLSASAAVGSVRDHTDMPFQPHLPSCLGPDVDRRLHCPLQDSGSWRWLFGESWSMPEFMGHLKGGRAFESNQPAFLWRCNKPKPRIPQCSSPVYQPWQWQPAQDGWITEKKKRRSLEKSPTGNVGAKLCLAQHRPHSQHQLALLRLSSLPAWLKPCWSSHTVRWQSTPWHDNLYRSIRRKKWTCFSICAFGQLQAEGRFLSVLACVHVHGPTKRSRACYIQKEIPMLTPLKPSLRQQAFSAQPSPPMGHPGEPASFRHHGWSPERRSGKRVDHTSLPGSSALSLFPTNCFIILKLYQSI